MVDFSKPGLAVFDMDSTLIGIECIDEIAALVGCKAEVSAITEQAMRGELDFADSLKARVALLRGVRKQQLQQLFQPIPLTSGAIQLVSWLQERQWAVGVVSGGFTWFTDQVAQVLNLDFSHANTLLWDNEQLSGEVADPVVDAQSKAQYLTLWARELELPLTQTLAVGDGANDIPMFQQAGFSVAFCAKPKVQAVADYCVDEPDLAQLIHYFETANSVI